MWFTVEILPEHNNVMLMMPNQPQKQSSEQRQKRDNTERDPFAE